MGSEAKNKLVDDLSSQVESRVKNLAITAARSAVRKLWNSSFASAIEHEITALYKSSFEENQESYKAEKSPVKSPQKAEKIPSPTQEVTASDPNIHMVNKAQTFSDTLNPVIKIDKIFIEILEDFASSIMGLTRKSTEYILDVSNSFMDERAQSTLQDFHDLYFGSSKDIQNTAEQVNAEVDGILEKLRKKIDKGQEISESDIDEESKQKTNRLSISGLQKRLETIISLDAGIKEKLIPVLHSMQFEDFLNQRLTHIKKIWRTILDREDQESSLNIEELKESLAKLPTSVPERETFYRIVLKKDPPEGIQEKQTLMDILF